MGSAVRRRWAGPPPLLIIATALAFMVAPLVSRTDAGYASDPPGTGPAAELSAAEVPLMPAIAPPPTAARGKVIERRDVVGVATFNQFYKLSSGQAVADARSLTSRPEIDVVGWQEAQRFGRVFAGLRQRGWATRQFPRGARELAISWRRSEFAYVSASSRLVAYGVDSVTGRYPFGHRYIIRVTLRHRPTGRLLSVINTHLPQKIEDLDRPGRWTHTSNAARARFQLERMRREWRQAPGRWVVGTGDYNFDAGADTRTKLPRGPSRALDEAVSSYAVLGTRNVNPTHPPTDRRIDYVHAAESDLKAGHIELLSQRTFGNLNSDHRALLVRMALR